MGALIPLWALVVLVVVACGVSYVITGSQIGYLIRASAWILLHWGPLVKLAFCPSCNAWWSGALLAHCCGFGWWQVLQAAFASCLVAALIQAQYGLAASDEEVIAGRWKGQ